MALICIALVSVSQPFADEIAAFKKKDSLSFPPKNAILFVGSSSFRLWHNIDSFFPGYTIINRGFGGSSLPDMIRYEKDIIFPYQPKQIVIYCGENDIAGDTAISAETVAGRFKQLFTHIRTALPGVPVVFVSIKPSPSRWQWRDKMMEANRLIKKYLKRKKHTKFVDVWKAMLGPNGRPEEDLFLADRLHMKPAGYIIWAEKIKPLLIP